MARAATVDVIDEERGGYSRSSMSCLDDAFELGLRARMPESAIRQLNFTEALVGDERPVNNPTVSADVRR